MKERIFIVSEIRNKFFDLTDLVPEMMEVENVSEEWAINYFMEGLKGNRYMRFPPHTPTRVITEWITQDLLMSSKGGLSH